ncbi:MKRN2 opposite strand protein [Anopheles ziemanni]|uniref:MKRN2 opposite strand protein n=1 Tax=Anopheles coustani TaxID=139045 RepID=UPI0026594EB0|nr:MKRN2 opposite strand protein [Anopheles coustani]XP_058121168.1 MKRN2 opposite strand protein [Anopheles coustani]XP_058121169.1 MKRN2 opposite strand protein [Anopheles coustani]XP_058166934.1 MKRN2 opposite strand protein [Anopheles ziemanni]
MSFYRDVICFKHCGKSIFTHDIATTCPLCHTPLGSSLTSIPLMLPYPFVKACQYPCSVVLRPSDGDFLRFFVNQQNLHIGLTASDGSIFEYDLNGLKHTATKNNGNVVWNQCILIAQVSLPWYDKWDNLLQQFFESTQWKKEDYHEQSHNCYTFILSFLEKLEHDELSCFCLDKVSFSQNFIVPKTQNAAKYITIHRKLNSCNYWIDK